MAGAAQMLTVLFVLVFFLLSPGHEHSIAHLS
jgi:hypothetical protein